MKKFFTIALICATLFSTAQIYTGKPKGTWGTISRSFDTAQYVPEHTIHCLKSGDTSFCVWVNTGANPEHTVLGAIIDRVNTLQAQVDSLKARAYPYLDLTNPRPGIWITNDSGQFDLLIHPVGRYQTYEVGEGIPSFPTDSLIMHNNISPKKLKK